MINILFWSIYWIVIYIILDLILEKNRNKIYIKLNYNKQLFKLSNKMKRYKEKIPSISRFNKNKISSYKMEYIKEYDKELSKAFLIHLLPAIFLIPLIATNCIIIVINTLFYLLFNIPFLLIIYYNKIRIQKILFKKEEKSKNEKS